MKILHTSDWHVGKTIRGNSRADEHRAVLNEIVALADGHRADVVLVAGDLFDTSAPTPESETIVYRSLLDLAETGATVAVIGGNHDNARRLLALTPLFELGNVHVVPEAVRPEDGAVVDLVVRGEPLRLAMLPFVSQRGIVRAGDLMAAAAFEHVGLYADRMRLLVETLTADVSADSVQVLMAHAYVLGGTAGGGERASHIVEDYAVPSTIFPPTLGYVALGHLHRPQKIPGPCPIHYCGSPLQLDFGEQGQVKQVNLVDAAPGKPAVVTPLPLTSGCRLETITGSYDELAVATAVGGDSWLRINVNESRRAGLADEVRALFGDRAVHVAIESEDGHAPGPVDRERIGRSANVLFAEYLAEREIADARLTTLFDELLEAAENAAG